MGTAKRRVRLLLWTLTGLLLFVFGVRSFVGDVYPVVSSSMEPSLYPGERVFMRFGKDGLERFDLVVVGDAADGPIVKRLVALPNERVALMESGDLWINGGVLDPTHPRPEPVRVFDDSIHDASTSFRHGSQAFDPWTLDDGVWELDARDVARGEQAGLLRYSHNLRDDRLGLDSQVVFGDYHVGDAILECELEIMGAGGLVRLELVEHAVTYQALLELENLPDVEVQLRRRILDTKDKGSEDDVMGPWEVLAESNHSIEAGDWTSLRFANVDDGLRLEVGSFELTYFGEPQAIPAEPIIGERVRLGGEGSFVRFRDIRIFRDLHYTERGEFGVRRQLTLGHDEIFVLGDNSAASFDSREFGPVPMDRVLGEPTWVVWPLDKWRRLGAESSQ